MWPKEQRNKKPQISHQLNSCTCLGAPWNSERKGPFFQAPARCLWGRLVFRLRTETSFLFKGNDYIKKCRERMICDGFSKKGQMSRPNIIIEAFHFLQMSPAQLPRMGPSLQKKQKTKNQFSKGVLIGPGTIGFAEAYTGNLCMENNKWAQNVFILLFQTTDCLNWEHEWEWECIHLYIILIHISRPPSLPVWTHLTLEIITFIPRFHFRGYL